MLPPLPSSSAKPRSALVELPAPDAGASTGLPRVVAYGDSLTAGYPSFESYAVELSKALAEAGHPVDLHVCGLCGLTAEQMAKQVKETVSLDCIGQVGTGLAELVQERHRGDRNWRAADLALIMAGTNDLPSSTPPDKIVASVRELHRACHAHGVRTVVLSIPDIGIRKYKRQPVMSSGRAPTARDVQAEQQVAKNFEADQRFKASRRRQANGLLAKWVRTAPSKSAPATSKTEESAGAPVASLEAYLKALDMEEQGESDEAVPSLEACLAKVDEDEFADRLELPDLFVSVTSLLPHGPRTVAAGCWETDGVHFTSVGSKLLGRRLAVLLQPLVARVSAAKVLGGGGAGEDGSAAPSLEAFMAAFELEDELNEKAKVKSGAPHGPAVHCDWEEDAALVLQRFLRQRKRR